MDLTRYINLEPDGKIQIVLGKISDISNQYLVLSFKTSEKKSASGKNYNVIDMTSSNQFFSNCDLNILEGSEIIRTFLNLFKSDLVGSIVRYEYDKYLCVGIWLNTYAQLNIPSPIFYNVENIMNDIRMMYFGKQSEEEILVSIRNNWYSSKYQDDLKIPLVDISKKFTDDFTIVQEPKEIDKFRDLLIGIREEKKSQESVGEFNDKYNICKFISNATNDLSPRPYNLFLLINKYNSFYDVKNNFSDLKNNQYFLVFTNEKGYLSNQYLQFTLPLINKKEDRNYNEYFLDVEGQYSGKGGYFFKAGDFIREDFKFSTNEKYEYGTIIEYKAKYVIIGCYYTKEESSPDKKLVYLSVNVSLFDKDRVTNNTFNKLKKIWSESEIDELAKKKKVFLETPVKSSYNSNAALSNGEITMPNTFQKQTMAKLTDDLDSIRNKNVVLYDAFINVINSINKKIESKIVKPEEFPNDYLYGLSIVTNRQISETILNEFLSEFLSRGEIDDYLNECIGNEKSGNNQKVKYFTNLDDLMKYSANILRIYTYLFYQGNIDNRRTTNLLVYINFHNLPIYTQQLYFNFRSAYGIQLSLGGQSSIVFSNIIEFSNINTFSFERQQNFYLNLIRLSFNSSYLQRIQTESILFYDEKDAIKKSLLMLKPYFSLDTELLNGLGNVQIIYGCVQLYYYGYSDYYWINYTKYRNSNDMPEDIYSEVWKRINFNIFNSNGSNELNEFKDFLRKYDRLSLEVFEGAPLPKSSDEIETDDFLKELDSMDFTDESLFADSVVNELENLDFEDPDLFN